MHLRQREDGTQAAGVTSAYNKLHGHSDPLQLVCPSQPRCEQLSLLAECDVGLSSQVSYDSHTSTSIMAVSGVAPLGNHGEGNVQPVGGGMHASLCS